MSRGFSSVAVVVAAVLGTAGAPALVNRLMPPDGGPPFTYWWGISAATLIAVLTTGMLVLPSLLLSRGTRATPYPVLALVGGFAAVVALWWVDPLSLLVRLDVLIGSWVTAAFVLTWLALPGPPHADGRPVGPDRRATDERRETAHGVRAVGN